MLAVLSFANIGLAMGATWTATGSMTTARFQHTATLLNNGMVLITGGYNGGNLTSAELYNPATGTFTATGSLAIGRYKHTATLLNNGMVLIAGGYNGGSSAELYNPTTGTFTATGSMTTARAWHEAILLNNGMVLIVGGYGGGTSAELYDPATGTFTATGSMTTERYTNTATLLNNGMVLVAGGSDAISQPLASAELYNPATGTFTATGSLAIGRYYHAATLLNNGMVLISGGFYGWGTTSAELYNPATGTFTTTGSLTIVRYGHNSTLMNNGMVLLTAGTNSGNFIGSADLYDSATGTFMATADMIADWYFSSATLLNNGMVLVAGGGNPLSFSSASAELYGEAPTDTVGPVTSNVSITPDPLAVNTVSSLSATVSDATTGGSNVASVVYSLNGVGASQMLLTPSAAVTTQASANLAPISQSNVYSVCVHGTDSAGNNGADACILLPVYDPNGGFVTGGGQVASPAGADLLNTSAAGQATFGFVSKYLPGMNTPSGNLQFQFKDGNLNFKSTSMDWLVVTGQPRAKFHGTGTVNGTNVCNFEVDAWAGSFTGNVDAFGLKISSCSNGGDRYSLPATALTKGSIIIHQ